MASPQGSKTRSQDFLQWGHMFGPRRSRIAALTFASIVALSILSGGCSKGASKSGDSASNPSDPGADTSPTTTAPGLDTTPLSPPIVLFPLVNPLRSTASSLTISGTCLDGATVSMSGSATDSAACSSSAYSFTVNQSSDATYVFSLTQDSNGVNTSPAATVTWTRDTTPPAKPTLASPANPYTSADSSFNISGGCESGATVSLSGQTTNSSTCSNSSFSFSVGESSDGSYNYSILQSDDLGNQSGSLAFAWTRNSSLPATPVITSPAISDYFSSGNSVNVAGSCTDGNTVNLSGTSSNSMVCASSSFSFTVNRGADGVHSYSVTQTNGSALTSGAATGTWTRDTVRPATPTVVAPTTNPKVTSGDSLIISGACENNATVSLSGPSSSSMVCSSSAYSFTVNNSSDANYTYSISQTDRAGNSALVAASQVWTRDTSSPSAPTITTPASSPHLTNGNSITLSGACETNAVVTLSGVLAAEVTGNSLSQTCTASAYSYSIAKSADGSYTLTVSQTDSADNTSGTTAKVWNRDTAAPAAPVVSNPSNSPYTSADGSLVISGTCEAGATVNLAGATTDATSCVAGLYSFTYVQATDATYNFTVGQTDPAGNTNPSNVTAVQWVKNSSIPATPVISAPVASTHYSDGSTLTVNGSCDDGNTVTLSGVASGDVTSPAGSLTQACASSAFSYVIAKSSDATYTLNFSQKNGSNISSGAVTVTWIRDTVAPSAPTITAPAASSVTNNSNTLTISGACEANATVALTGPLLAEVSNPGSLTQTCSSGGYSWLITKSSDGSFGYSVKQTDLAGNISGSTSRTWNRDTSAPSVPTVASPAANPYTSNASSLVVSGSCEASAAIIVTSTGDNVSPESAPTVTCTSGGSFSFTATRASNGSYDYTISQIDVAGNSSSSTSLTWIRDNTIPFTPVLSSPTLTNGVIYTNGNSITITGTCDTAYTPTVGNFNIDGDLVAADVTTPSAVLTQTCTSSPKSFVVAKSTDGRYNFLISQENPNVPVNSASVSLTWIRDTAVPTAPVVSNPATTPYTSPGNLTISGTCESNTTVTLTGAIAAEIVSPSASLTQTCTAGVYSYVIAKASDATYDFTVTQTDLASNISAATSRQWIRDSNSVPPPIITSPASSPYLANAANLTLNGTCTAGLVITLSGVLLADVTNPSSLTQTCEGGTFSWLISKSSDGTFNLSLKQTFNAVDSAAAVLAWTRDTTEPATTLATFPGSNLQTVASFTFTSETNATFECKLDSGSYAGCTSPKAYSGLSNGSHTFLVRAKDLAGNYDSTPSSKTWTQAGYSTVALYHMNFSGTADTEKVDASSYTQTGGFANGLTLNGTPTKDTTGKYPATAAISGMTFGTSKYLSVTDNDSLDVVNRTMTVDGFFKLTTLVGNNTYVTLVSKNSNSSPNYGWEVRLKKGSGSGKHNLSFAGSITGTSALTEVLSTNVTLSTNTWYYFAVTYNLGSVSFYVGTSGNVTALGTKTFATSGSVLATTAAPLYIGANATSGTNPSAWMAGSVDEVRISQTVRTITTVPTAEFGAD